MNDYYSYSPAMGDFIKRIKKLYPNLDPEQIEHIYVQAYHNITTNEDHKFELIKEINGILETYNYDMFYKVNSDGTIEFNPFSLVYNRKRTEIWMHKAYERFWDDIKYTFTENVFNDITKKEYTELKKNNFDSQLFEKIVIKKVCNSLGIKNKELIKKINITDEVPIELLVSLYIRYYGIEKIQKKVSYSLESVVEEISSLGIRYGNISTIDFINKYLLFTVNKIKEPELPKEKIIEYIRNMDHDDIEKVYFSDALNNYPSIKDKESFTKYYESKFMKEELTKQKHSLVNSKNNKSNPNTRKLKKNRNISLDE